MKPEYRKNTKAGLITGIVLQFAGRQLISSGSEVPGMVLALLGAVLFIWGCMSFAQGKGYSKWFGLLGMLSCLGLLILELMEDRHPQPEEK